MRVAGLGFRDGTPLASLRAVLAAVEARGGPADALATLPEKAAALRPLAEERGLPLLAVTVAGVGTPTQSPRIAALHATGSVAEAAALVAAGTARAGHGGAAQDATLTVTRMTAPDGMATCAMAETKEDTR